jgi:hypothetical protein
MLAFDYVLALVLLTGPPGLLESDHPPDLYRALHQPLQELSIQLEILDPREVRYILIQPDDFFADISLLRKRYHDLAQAPAVKDSYRFPDRTTINGYLTFNRAYRQQLDHRQPKGAAEAQAVGLARQETDQLYGIWDCVRDARCDYYYLTVRRQVLKRLRELIGAEAYQSGNLPPCVPLWRLLLDIGV